MVAWLTRMSPSPSLVTPALRLRVPSSKRNCATEASSRSGAGGRGGAAALGDEQPASGSTEERGQGEQPARAARTGDAGGPRRTLTAPPAALSTMPRPRVLRRATRRFAVRSRYLICEIRSPA